MSSPTDEALAEFNARLAERGIRARVDVHDGMTAVMIHRDGDTTAMIDGALGEGPEVVGQMVAQIARERNLPAGWLSRVGAEPPTESAQHWLTSGERSLQIVSRMVAQLAERCVTVARRPDASKIEKRIAISGVNAAKLIVKLARKLPSTGARRTTARQAATRED